jgi:hypothetical protein
VNCGFGLKPDELPTVPPYGRAALPFGLFPVKPHEEFSARSTLFFEWRGRIVQFKVTVAGTAAAAQ